MRVSFKQSLMPSRDPEHFSYYEWPQHDREKVPGQHQISDVDINFLSLVRSYAVRALMTGCVAAITYGCQLSDAEEKKQELSMFVRHDSVMISTLKADSTQLGGVYPNRDLKTRDTVTTPIGPFIAEATHALRRDQNALEAHEDQPRDSTDDLWLGGIALLGFAATRMLSGRRDFYTSSARSLVRRKEAQEAKIQGRRPA